MCLTVPLPEARQVLGVDRKAESASDKNRHVLLHAEIYFLFDVFVLDVYVKETLKKCSKESYRQNQTPASLSDQNIYFGNLG